MRLSVFFTLSTALIGGSALLSGSAFAADAGTYRPGSAYHSITAGSPTVCEMQCSGDAQCRSWNYIRVNQSADGVCEFNDNIASPIPSAISVSGNNVLRGRSTSVIAGQTNTVRVGAPSAAQITPQVMQQAQTRAASYQQPSAQRGSPSLIQQQMMNDRRIAQTSRLAKPAPQSLRTPQQHAATHRAPQRAQFRHSLEDNQGQRAPMAPQQPGQTAPQMKIAPSAYALADPRLHQKLQQRGQVLQNSAPQTTPLQNTAPQTYAPAIQQAAPQVTASAGGFSAPPGVPPIDTPAMSSYMSPAMAGAPMPPRRVNIPSELSPRAMGAGDSLFGSLYDDVKIPRPIDPALAADPNAPIPTVSSVPTSQIYSAPLPPAQ